MCVSVCVSVCVSLAVGLVEVEPTLAHALQAVFDVALEVRHPGVGDENETAAHRRTLG